MIAAAGKGTLSMRISIPTRSKAATKVAAAWQPPNAGNRRPF
ncbi:MAG: hypothetical protein BMS9Abin04_577 [Planctomycetia bacterium]|nr:MAG: hypothetical protein BMS9Abin04_577 [Planctomycetia bacterium]